jgi:putative RNA 2'-phosphotransferase
MTDKSLNNKSKFLAYILRHKPEKANLKLEKDGWVSVYDLISNTDISMDELEEIVKTDDKKRYSFNIDNTKVRANQGHSTNTVIKFTKKIPPVILYHGTSLRFWISIQKNGLDKMNRQYVHLSKDIETAYKVGVRHGEPIILKINCLEMVKDGYDFFISDNGVWLTDNVPPKYITKK